MILKFSKEFNIFLVIFFGITWTIFAAVNGGAYIKNMRYWLLSYSSAESERRILDFSIETETHSILTEDISGYGEENSTPSPLSGLGENYALEIPKIAVSAPIAIPAQNTYEDTLASLERGVGLYPGSDPFGAGRSILLGHSSQATWYRGEWATVFALLEKLEPGDEIFVLDGNRKWTYRVYSKQILTPSETNELLSLPPSQPELALITCFPIGSASKRTVIRANLAG